MELKVDYYRVLVRISFLAPDIVAAILEERQPGTLTKQKLARIEWRDELQWMAAALLEPVLEDGGTHALRHRLCPL